jgi:uncharacterized membrane protein YukC
MTNDEQILATLTKILEVQQKALANQEQAINQQQIAIQRQTAHMRLYKIALITLAPALGYMLYVFYSMPKPH